LMRGYEAFCGVQIVTFCQMTNHFHLLLRVPRRPALAEQMPTDSQLVELARLADYSYSAPTLKQDLERFRARGENEAAEELRERLFCRMWDVSWFMKMLKQRFTQWYNRRVGRKGPLWEDRFHSVLVEGVGPALAAVAAYIDLNPIRAGIVEDPAEYRWCGYAEAMAGDGRAKMGLRVAVEALEREEVTLQRAMEGYRRYLYFAGEEVKEGDSPDGPCPGRKGFSREEVEAMIQGGGKIPLAEALRHKVRYFCDGQVFGSRAFVNAFFAKHRDRFGKKRKSGARPLRGIDGGDLYTIRDLRKQVVS
jgi:putative transposase